MSLLLDYENIILLESLNVAQYKVINCSNSIFYIFNWV